MEEESDEIISLSQHQLREPQEETQQEHINIKECETSSSKKLNLTEAPSSYWRYYEKPNDTKQEKVKCLQCSNMISRGKNQSTSALLKHLQCQHLHLHKKIVMARQEMQENARPKQNLQKPAQLCEKKFTQAKLTNMQVVI